MIYGPDSKPLDSRNVLNAVASVRAGQEQMQRDVDKLRAGMAATVTMLIYLLGAGLLGLILYSKARKP